jgi:large subunit ribosomal protein L25
MEQPTLKAEPRDILGKKVKILRGKDQIPAILYGRNFPSQPLVLSASEVRRITQEAGEATLINLEVPGQKPMKVLIRHLQKDPVKDHLIHLDLYKVDMSQTIQTEIPLEFIGTSAAVEELEGNLITNKTSVEVECLPEKLVSQIEVDISPLKTFEDLILVKDLKIPEGIKVLDDPETVVAQVTPPRSEEELAALEEEAKAAATTEKEQIETMEQAAEAETEAKAKAEEAETGGEPTEEPKPPKEA